jgi:hypothetical protein
MVFLAGSIGQGKAAHWQAEAIVQLRASHPDVVVANPRRARWDSSWAQTLDHPAFVDQVEWELDHLLEADQVLFVFDGDTLSPVTLLELGLVLGQHPDRVTVVCPPHFWRHGNVAITARRFGVPVFATLEEGLHQVRSRL